MPQIPIASRRISLAWLLAGLAALPLLTLGMVTFLVLRSASDVTESAGNRLQAAARLVAAEAQEIIASTRSRLERFVDSRQPDSLVTGAAPTSAAEAPPGLFGFVLVFGADGVLRTVEDAQQPVSISERDYFQALKQGQDWSVSGLLQQSAFGEPVFAIARRLNSASGFAGAAVMYVPADAIVNALPALEIGREAAVALYRPDGALITHYPVSTAAGSFLDAASLKMAQEAGWAGRVLDDGARLTALLSEDGMGLIAAASTAKAPIVELGHERVRTTLMTVAPVAVVLLIVCVLMSIALLRQEQYLRALNLAAHQNQTLLQEIHHRIKNNLQMVAALVKLQPGEESQKQILSSRIHAMGAVHQLMYESGDFSALDARSYVQRLLDGLAAGQQDASVTIECDVEEVSLTSDQVQPIGLLINEAVTNAMKHAFPGGRSGAIKVTLKRAGRDAVLVVEDNGIGLAETAPTNMGTKLMRNLARQIGGDVVIRSDDGTKVSVRFPLVARAIGASTRGRSDT